MDDQRTGSINEPGLGRRPKYTIAIAKAGDERNRLLGSGTKPTLKLLNAKPMPFVFVPIKVKRTVFALGGKSLNEKVHGKPSRDEADSSTPSGDNSDASTLPELLSTS